MEKEDLDEHAELKLLYFKEKYRAALIMNSTLLESIGHRAEKLENVDDLRWNTLNDLQILFGLLYYREGFEKRLVTNEYKIKESCIKAGVGTRLRPY
jgi:hypothetical protein